MTLRTQLRISGMVQGVFFRVSARDEARRLGLAGFARNNPDGTVLIEVEGNHHAVERFVAWCHEGPPDAQVTNVSTARLPVKGDEYFSIG